MENKGEESSEQHNRAAGMIKSAYCFVSMQIVTVLALLLVLEGLVRFFADPIVPVDINAGTMITGEGQEPYFQYHPFAAFNWIPNARFLKQKVNSQGFVSTREIPFSKEPGEFRIITLGGSSTVGNGNVDEQTYPRILEKLMQERFLGRKINLINGAAGGYTTRESLGYLQARLIYYRPDIVIVMHGWNDMYYFTKSDEELSQWRKDFNLQAMWNPKVGLKLKDPMPRDLQYLSWSQLYLHLRDYVRKKSGFSGANTVEKRYEGVEVDKEGKPMLVMKPINSKAFDIYRDNLEQMKTLCDANGIRMYSILQPTLFTKVGQKINERLQRSIEISMAYHAFGYQEHLDAFQKIYQLNREVFGEEFIIDATSMNGHEELFFDHIHESPQGTAALAKIVLDKFDMVLRSSYAR